MGDTYTRQSTYTDGDVITAAHTNDEFNQLLAAFAASSGHTHDGTTAEGGPVTKLLGNSLTFGAGTAGTDITITFDGETNDGVLKWMEDEDYFEFSDDILIASTEKLQFRDTAIYINSSADGQLDIVADTEIQIAATTIDINGLVDISGNLSVGGNLDVTGTFDLSDSNFTNAGNIQLDSISGDGDTDTSITFSGSDVITVANAGTNQVTFNDGSISPVTDSDVDLGTTSLRFKDVYIDSATVTGEVAAASLDISGNIDVDGVTNLDVVDIDGAVNMATTALVTGVLTTTATQVATGGITSGSNIVSDTDSTDDLGTTSVRWANLFVDGITATDQITATGFTGTLDGILGSGSAAAATVTTLDTSGAVNLNLVTDSTSSTSGALIVDGGVGIAKKLYVGTDLDVDGTTNLDVVDIDGAVDMATTLAVAGNVDFNGDLDVDGTTNLDVVDIDGAVDMASTLQVDGVATFTGRDIHSGGITIANAGQIGSVGDTDAIAIASDGVVTLTQKLVGTELDISGNIDVDGTTNLDVVDIDGAVDMASTLQVDGAITNSSTIVSAGKITADAGIDIDNFNIDGTTIALSSGNLDIDVAGNVTIDADGGTVTFADGGASLGTITSSGYSGTAAVATTVTITDNESTNENNTVVFVAGADADGGNVGLESDGNLTYNPSTGTLSATNISVSGTFSTVDSVTMSANNAVIFEGATADAHETTLTVVDATADRTITLPNVSGTVPVLAAASNTQVTSTPEELNLLDGITAGTVSASLAVIADSNKDITGFRNVTLTGELDAGSLDVSGDIDVDGTTNLDAVDIDGAVQLDATLTVGANDQGYDVILYGDTASANLTWDTSADDLIFNGAAGLIVPDGQLTLGSTAITSTAAEINLIDGGTARGTTAVASGDGILINDAGTMRMTNVDTVSTYFAGHSVGGSNIVTTGALNSGSITSGFGTIDTGASAITTTGVITGGTLEATTDTAAGDNAAIGYTAAEGLILTGQGSTSDITLKNDADAVVFTVPTGTDDILFPDNAKALFGAGSDLQIYHDASNSYISDTGTGNLFIKASNNLILESATGENYLAGVADGAVSLYHNSAVKIATSATGVTVTGTAVATTDTDTSNTGSVTLDFAANQNFVLTLTGNVTLANPTTEQVGQSGFISFIQDGTGSRVLSVGSQYFCAGGSVIVLSTAANSIDIVPYVVVAAGKICLGAPQLAFADAS